MTTARIIKGTIYSLVVFNLLYYAHAEFSALETLPANASMWQILRGLGSTIDYVAWMILIAIFEIESAFRKGQRFTGTARRIAVVISTICYAGLAYAGYTYIDDFLWYDRFASFDGDSACDVADGEFYFLDHRENYVALTAENCANLDPTSLLLHDNENTLITPEAWKASWRLSVVNLANAAAWLILLLMTQLRIESDRVKRVRRRNWSAWITATVVLYGVLTFNAVYWIAFGNWIDGWDASLWLIAIALIEWNIIRFRPGPVP